MPHRFQNVRGSERVHFKIHERNFFRLIMRRLGRAVEDGVKAVLLEERKNSLTVANIHIAMFKPRRGLLQARKIPRGVSRRPEELTAHVVVHADHRMPLPVEILHSLGSDQPAAPGNKRGHHPRERITLTSLLGEFHLCELKR